MTRNGSPHLLVALATLGLSAAPAAAQTFVAPATTGTVADTNGDDVGDNSFSPARLGDEDSGNPFLTDRQEDRSAWEFNIDPVRSEIENALQVFFEVSITDKMDPLSEGDAKLNFQLHAMQPASENGSRDTFDYHSPASPVGPVFVFAEAAPPDRLVIDVTNAAKQDAAGPGDFSGYRFQVLVPLFVGDDDGQSEYVEFEQGAGANARLVIYGVGDPPPAIVPALDGAGLALLFALTAACGAQALRRRPRRGARWGETSRVEIQEAPRCDFSSGSRSP